MFIAFLRINIAFSTQKEAADDKHLHIDPPTPPVIQNRKVAVYCRVSSSRGGQASSLQNQKDHFEAMVRGRPDWELVEIYYEKGRSGTNARLRPELRRMLADARNGNFDLIITKSISRFARNTADCIVMVRALRKLGVELYFGREKLFTGSVESDFLLPVLSSLAEDESRSLSGNSKWAVVRRYQNGTFRLSRPPYGYDLVDGQPVNNEEEAAVVRTIFSCILNGEGMYRIAQMLNRNGIPSKRGGAWNSGTLCNMVRNEFLTVDLLMQKTFRESSGRRLRNYGEEDKFLILNHHPVIISRETFATASEVLRLRGQEKNNLPLADPRARNNPHRNRYPFTGKIFCLSCGCTFNRQVVSHKSGRHACRVCNGRLADPGSCSMGKIWEDNLKSAFITMLNKLAWSESFLLEAYRRDLAREGHSRDSPVRKATSYLAGFLRSWSIEDQPFPVGKTPQYRNWKNCSPVNWK